MKLFFTQSTQHLAPFFADNVGQYTYKKFSDGELCLRLEQDVTQQSVWVVASTQAPADNILELFFLLDALERAHASLHLCLTYYGYSRQDRALVGEPISAAVLARCLSAFDLKKCIIVHSHNDRVLQWLACSSNNVIPYPYFYECAASADVIVAPDSGAAHWATALSKALNKELILVAKERLAQEKVAIKTVQGSVAGKKVLIVDDIIATAHTIVQLSGTLQQAGASSIAVAATHGIFCDDAYWRIEQSAIDRVYVTNSVKQPAQAAKVTVISLASYLQDLIKDYLS